MIKKINILLPVYNEGESIYNLLAQYSGFFQADCAIEHKIFVINDNSKDNTEKFILKAVEDFKNLNIEYKKNEENLGLHGIIKNEFVKIAAIVNDDEIVVTMDGDNTHNPFLIKDMIDKINQGADVVIASRYCEQSRIKGLSKYRTMLSLGARYLYSVLWHIAGVKDYTCNFRAYRAFLIKKLIADGGNDFIKEKGFTAVAEILKRIGVYKPVVVEVPMILVYSNKLELSNMRVLPTVLKTLKMLFRGS